MIKLIEEATHRAPDRLAVGVADGSMCLSYGQVAQLAGTLARQFAAAGITSGERIALYCDNRPEFALTLLAAWVSGAAVVPIDPQLTSAEVGSRLVAVNPAVVLVPGSLRDRYPLAAGDTPAWVVDIADDHATVNITDTLAGPDDVQPGPRRRTADQAQGRDIALLLFTAGSTGAPKIVPLSQANLAVSVSGIESTYHLGPDDATLLVMPLFHGHGLIDGLLATFASGGAAYFPATGRFSAHLFWDEIVTAKATWYTAVPTIHQILLARATSDYPADDPPALRFIRSCSASLAPAVLHATREHFGAPVIPAYGMTEAAHQVASNPLPQDGACKDASVGPPTELRMRIVTPGGAPAATGQTGEICLRGPTLTSGYLNDAEATATAFSGGWFRTGDLGHVDSDGYLFLTGRTKEMINRGGEKIAPQTIEAVLLADPVVQDALAFAAPDAKYGEEVNAAVILKPGRHATQDDLRHYCQARLSAFEIPKKIYFLDRFPRTAKGDADRRALSAALAPR